MVPNEHYSNAMSLNGATMTTARAVGPAIAGLLVTQVGFGWTFMADGLSFIAVLTGLALMRPHELTPVVPAPRQPGQIRRSDPPHPQPTGAVGPDGAVDLHRRVGLQLRRQHPVARHRPPPRRRGHVHDPVRAHEPGRVGRDAARRSRRADQPGPARPLDHRVRARHGRHGRRTQHRGRLRRRVRARCGGECIGDQCDVEGPVLGRSRIPGPGGSTAHGRRDGIHTLDRCLIIERPPIAGARAGMAIGAVGCALGVWWVLRSDFDPQPPTGRSVAQ
ncbi:MAG: MFS transporter [Ilumatobacteraceae bacterium]